MNPFFAKFLTIIFLTSALYADPPEEFVATTVVPPSEQQNGGNQIFKDLTPASETLRLSLDPINERMFVNQTLDLNKLGPGTSLTFACDVNSKTWAFAFSNGRFDASENVGSIKDGTYPNNAFKAEGKYGWPVDNKGRFLPGDKLVTSNGPHRELERVINAYQKQHRNGGATSIIGGSVTIDHNGKAFIGYISGSTNLHYKTATAEYTYEMDFRALPFELRQFLHKSMLRAFSGRDIERAVTLAPQNEIQFRQRKKINHSHKPYLSPAPKNNSHLKLIAKQMDQASLRSYIERLPPVNRFLLLSSDIKFHKNYPWLQSLYLSSRSETRANIDNYFEHPRALTKELMAALTIIYKERVFDVLIDNGIPANSSIQGQGTLVSEAVETQNNKGLKRLIAAGAHINRQDRTGNTPLHRAVIIDNKETLRILIERRANPNIRNANGETALYLAAFYNEIELCKALIEIGGSLDIANDNGETARDRATKKNYSELIELFQQERVRQYRLGSCEKLSHDIGF